MADVPLRRSLSRSPTGGSGTTITRRSRSPSGGWRDADLRKALGRQGSDFVRRNFAWPTVLDRYEALPGVSSECAESGRRGGKDMSDGRGPETYRRLQEARAFLEDLREGVDAAAPGPISSHRPSAGAWIVRAKQALQRALLPVTRIQLSRQTSFNDRLVRLLGELVGTTEELLRKYEEAGVKGVEAETAANRLSRRIEGIEKSAGFGAAEAGIPVRALQPPPARGGDLSADFYVAFEERFRGSEEDVRRKLEAYVPLFEGLANVLDAGCGRGEFLELLKARGILAKGVDASPAMAARCREKGLAAEQGDIMEALQKEGAASLGGVFSAQVVEHLSFPTLASFVREAHRALGPGGVFVVETVNPLCLTVFRGHSTSIRRTRSRSIRICWRFSARPPDSARSGLPMPRRTRPRRSSSPWTGSIASRNFRTRSSTSSTTT